MMVLSVRSNFPDVERQLARLQEDIATKVTVRSVNRTIEQARTDMSREIRAEFSLSASKVREKLFIEKAGYKGGRFGVVASLLSRDPRGKRRSINVINFAARQTAKGVSVKVKKGGGRKVITGAFIGNKERTVFRRVGKGRLPIQPVQGIDVPQMFNTRRVQSKVVQAMGPKFIKNVQHEIAFALRQFGSR